MPVNEPRGRILPIRPTGQGSIPRFLADIGTGEQGAGTREASDLAKKKDAITIYSSALEYLTYIASIGD